MTGSRLGARRDRERRTVAAMIAIFCRERHASGASLCAECSELEAYTRLRLDEMPLRRGEADLRRLPDPLLPAAAAR